MSSQGSFIFSSLIQKLWSSRKVIKREEKQEDSKWKHLPAEVLELIMERLCLNDYLKLRKVCSPWRRIVNKAIANQHCFPLTELPQVVLISSHLRSTEQSFYSLKTEQEHPKRSLLDHGSIEFLFDLLKNPKIISCHGSIKGWMIMMGRNISGSLYFFFFNPVTNRRMSVTSLLYPSNFQIQNESRMGKMVASSKPDCYNSDYFLAGLFGKNIAYYRLLDKSWHMIQTNNYSRGGFEDVEIVGFKLYIIVKKPLNTMLVYDLKDYRNGSQMPKVLALPQTRMTRRVNYDIPFVKTYSGVMRHLAKHETLEQLFLIYITWSRTYIAHMYIFETGTPLEIIAVDVFKLDINKEPVEWIKCESLDDNVIFVGTGNSLVISRASFNSTQDSIGENDVYFALSLGYFMNTDDPISIWTHTDVQIGTEVRLGIKHLTDSNIKFFSPEKETHSRILVPCWLRPSI